MNPLKFLFLLSLAISQSQELKHKCQHNKLQKEVTVEKINGKPIEPIFSKEGEKRRMLTTAEWRQMRIKIDYTGN